MDVIKIGKAIAYLRKRAGYTQKDLADRIGISDKAVSKWERGLGLPDIGYLRKLSILLDTDTDSLLAGDVVHHNGNWRGIILLEPNVNGIGAGTMVYDKPLVYYLLSYFMLVGIRDITLVGSAEDKRWMDAAMGDGGDFGIRLTAVAGTLRDALDNGAASAENVMLVYGRCLLYGVDQTRFFQKAMVNRDRFTMLVLPKKIDHRTPRVAMDLNRKVVVNSEEDVLRTQYDFSGIPIVFFPAALLPEVAAAPEVASFISRYSAQNDMYVQLLDRGFVEIEAKDWHSVREAASFFQIVQDSCGMNVYCLEEVAWRRGFISAEQLRTLGERRAGTDYGDYILSLCQRIVVTPESD